LRQGAVEHLHVHFGTNAATVARLIRRLGGPSYSLTIHGPVEFDDPEGLSLGAKVADSAFTVGISDYTTAQIRRWVDYSHWERIHVVHCCIDDAFLAAPPANDDGLDRIVCVGRLTAQKGQLLLIDAVAQVVKEGVDARLTLVGDGEMRREVEERIAAANLEDRIEITGWMDEAGVRRCIAESRCLVLPSFAEGLPVVIMEAFAMARPVISTYVAGIPELVRDRENGWLVPAGNAEALAVAIRRAYGTAPEALEAMGRAGRTLVEERHRSATEVSRLEALFREVRFRSTPSTPDA
jgi:glycosyltransferase involved in cell wall biosynthesis